MVVGGSEYLVVANTEAQILLPAKILRKVSIEVYQLDLLAMAFQLGPCLVWNAQRQYKMKGLSYGILVASFLPTR